MNLQDSQTNIVEQPKVCDEPDKYLNGNILLIARVAWIVLALFILTLNVVMLPLPS